MKSMKQWLRITFGKHVYVTRPPDGGFLILMQDNKITLIKEGYHKDRWGLPGRGFILGKNQSVFGAGVDETREETGLSPRNLAEVQLLFITSKKRKARFGLLYRWYLYFARKHGNNVYNFNNFYLCRNFVRDPDWRPDEVEVKEVRSCTFAEIFSPEMNLTDGSRRILTILYYYLHLNQREFVAIMQGLGCCQVTSPFEFSIDEDLPPIPPPPMFRIVD